MKQSTIVILALVGLLAIALCTGVNVTTVDIVIIDIGKADIELLNHNRAITEEVKDEKR